MSNHTQHHIEQPFRRASGRANYHRASQYASKPSQRRTSALSDALWTALAVVTLTAAYIAAAGAF